MSVTLLSSPLQGFTDFRFRNAFHQSFGGIDTFYAPYIKMNGKMVIKNNYQRDLNPEHNTVPHLIPQVMTNDPDEFLFVIKYIASLGYTELNWNLGCPYPMVTKQGMGSGLICNPMKIDEVLHKAHNESDITISMKMRLGYDEPSEILNVFPILEKYPIKNVAIHARLGKQLYKGGTDLDAFQKCVDQSPHKLYYNGDVTSVQAYRDLQERFPSIDHWMIGRGLIADPFLPQMIKNNTTEYPTNRWQIFKDFHDTIYKQYDEALSGPMPIKMKMLGFWEYFSQSFNDPKKVYKAIKKNGSPRNYVATVNEIFAKQR
ncbi:tRNA-dihydrouridine synthase [Formosa agariphila KMM 3901]|uniref:tRNA-dihydrouridine synthase n=1 Tax=Formosa agariphila (strain DSM 15362 / KCTC 12365 / LMG 23005 / KMM 3901 / M-2Alg 35-1) TaxID=1347342 RepID=T2KN25_FORAG|nr:tRNA-dihydrouridine synthase family protein [Formosa agariphila]CDF80160.1 tRNA-dihydrouridine synthase [Formosa agariphila KMM 3901]